MTSTTGRRIQPQKFRKVCAGLLGAAVVAAATVTCGSAGIASACPIGAQCNEVQNSTGYTVYDNDNSAIPTGVTVSYSTLAGTVRVLTFTMPANSNSVTASWTLTYANGAGALPNGYGYTSGSAPAPASFGYLDDASLIETLTLGGVTHSFDNGGGGKGGGGTVISSAAPSGGVRQVNYASGTPSNTRGTVIVVNEKPVKIWNPRMNRGARVVASLVAPVSSVAADSPVASSIPTQAPSAAKASAGARKVATNRTAARR
jgi:hypothetical protein